MSWLDLTWATMGAASLTLGIVHLFIWRKQRSQYPHLLFFALGASIAACAAFELSMMRSATVQGYASALRWAQVPLLIAFLSMVGFVRLYFAAGRAWLAWAVCLIRLPVVALDFLTGANINFETISALQHVTLWRGAGFSVPVGTLNPWWSVAQLDNILLCAFLLDASVTLWRRGGSVERRRSVLVGGALILCVGCVVALSLGTFSGHLQLPTVVTPTFLVVALAMGYELGEDALRSAQLARDLRDSERRSELAAQAARLALWSWDVARGELWMNAIGRTLFGLAEVDQPDLEVLMAGVHADDRDRVRDAIDRTLRDGGSLEQEFRVALPGTATRWVVTRALLEREASEAGLLRGVTVDITERRRVEQEAAQQRNELAHLSRVAALGEMAGSLAHEINQPLMAILSNARAALRFMASEDGDLAEVRAILADIVEDDKRAGEVIHRLRALLRKGEVQRGLLDINHAVQEVLRLTRNELLNRGVVVTTQLAPDAPRVLGDRIQVQQVLLNLVINSCDAMAAAPGSQQLVVRTRPADGAGVEVSVSDSGHGISPADLERIFEPFVTSKEHGMGLGLSVCRTIVAAHGGRLWAESVDGKGATMRFTLPVEGVRQ
ncbi:MAG TPA: ATP-binding protein [Steroidobacteraceae bacterium]|nr:ATP-binding protein [Steroidobacteraceae bacterium]